MSNSKTSIYGALIANALIGIMKFIASYFTGSSAMLSEGIHSTVDSCNQVLLLFGIRQSKKPADNQHPFGHGKEIYFWSLIVAVLIFGLGGGMSVYEGIKHIQHPEEITNLAWNYSVLAGAFIFEGASLYIAIRNFNKSSDGENFFRRLHNSKDPSSFVVIYEDGAALAGIIIAALGIFLGSWLNQPVFDGISSVLIGVILAAVAVRLVIESRNLLIGESVDAKMIQDISGLVKANPHVDQHSRPMTMHMSPEEVLLVLDVQFRKGLKTSEIAETVRLLEKDIREKFPTVKRIFIEARDMVAAN